MAGAGFKTFASGEVLTAANVNTYLMQQTVMVFADSSARSTALGANVSEGMLSYLKDTNQVEVYNGSAWVASDDPNAIQNTIVDAKGDLISATAADTPARLAVGANDTVLTADSSTATGLKWAAAAGGLTFTLAASGSLSGNSTNVTGLTGSVIIYSVTGASHNGGGGGSATSDIYVGFNNNATIMRFDTSSSLSTRQQIGANTSAASTHSFGGFVIGANSSSPEKPVFLGQTSNNRYTLSTSSSITAVTFSLESGINFDAGTYEIWTA